MKNEIEKIAPGSIAEEAGLEVGDCLISINGEEVKDIIDYKFLLADEYIELEILKPNNEIWDIEIEKEYQEDLGIEFKSAIMDKARSCSNKCIFCFIDQLPKGMRETLYFKDDDSRLSFLQGNFVTLTNMSDDDIDRIIRYRISPINVSVHTTNPELRKEMLNNRFAGNIYERLKKLADANIAINCQIVLCPGVNNGVELVRTVEDLYKLYPSVRNIAAVPVGLSKHREGLKTLIQYNKESAEKEIDLVAKLQEKYMKEIGEPFVRLSDEFYVTAKRDVPETEFYGDFEQLEDGVGMIRILRDNIRTELCKLDKNKEGSFTFITGASGYEEVLKAAEVIKEHCKNININCLKVINRFFGETITVAGLLTGRDIIEQASTLELNEIVIIPSNMLRSGERIFLDDLTVEDLEKEINRRVIICDYSGDDLVASIDRYLKEE